MSETPFSKASGAGSGRVPSTAEKSAGAVNPVPGGGDGGTVPSTAEKAGTASTVSQPISKSGSTMAAVAPTSTRVTSAPRIGVVPMTDRPAPYTPNKALTFEGFSITHAAILDGTQSAEVADIYGIREGSLEADTDSYDNTGDDSVLSTWNWFNYATVTIQAGYIPFETLSLIYGIPIVSSTSGTDVTYEFGLWTEKSLNSPRVPVLLRVPSKDAYGAVREFDFILYNCQFEPMSFDGPTYKDGLLLNYSARALMSDVDELGNPLDCNRAIGRIINRPGVVCT